MTPEEQHTTARILERTRQAHNPRPMSVEDTRPQEAKQIGIVFFVATFIIAVVADTIDIITAGTIGLLFGLFFDAILLIAYGFSSNARKQFKKMLVVVFGEKILLISVFPIRSGFVAWTYFKSHAPILAAVEHNTP